MTEDFWVAIELTTTESPTAHDRAGRAKAMRTRDKPGKACTTSMQRARRRARLAHSARDRCTLPRTTKTFFHPPQSRARTTGMLAQLGCAHGRGMAIAPWARTRQGMHVRQRTSVATEISLSRQTCPIEKKNDPRDLGHHKNGGKFPPLLINPFKGIKKGEGKRKRKGGEGKRRRGRKK